jgi:hypothetical protein
MAMYGNNRRVQSRYSTGHRYINLLVEEHHGFGKTSTLCSVRNSNKQQPAVSGHRFRLKG